MADPQREEPREPPPSYDAVVSNDNPPAYGPPNSYRIGTYTFSAPLVTVEQLKAHLSLLRAFKGLRATVEEGEDVRIPRLAAVMEPSARWAWFVGLSVDRMSYPPLDVLMVWHAYLLNPFCYAEDTLRLRSLSDLREVNDYLLKAIMHVGDISTFEAAPERKESWFQQTGTPYDPLDAAAQMTNRDVECPNCFTRVSVSYLTSDGGGYSQHLFAAPCPSCQFAITRDGLAVLKFARDVVLDPANVADVQRHGKGVFLPGTLRTLVKAFDEAVGKSFQYSAKQIFDLREPSLLYQKEDWLRQVLKRTGFSMPKVRAAITQICKSRGRPYKLRFYMQGSFIDKMHKFEWTRPGYFESQEDEVVLLHTITRYHADDKIEVTYLANSFDETCRAWEVSGSEFAYKAVANSKRSDVFGVPYTYCGCPLPGSTVGQRLSRLTHRLMHFRSSSTSDDLIPPQRADALSATHASEHNMVPMVRSSRAAEMRNRERTQQVSRWRERDEKLARQGKIDKALLRRGEAHDVAFLYPVPFIVAPPTAGCVAVGASWTTGAGGCAVGVSTCSTNSYPSTGGNGGQ
ncbi:hypothetical protein NM688_g1477 [Phlebia brevispora]|uniref:Uncharacterized protein n=1 Tax=Phlebia brevispora TaxID=194682 RepID=A0ACC1TBF2_9APHY|nr:hypothetical protein NM688_g1477 [Phlebia brevispora]